MLRIGCHLSVANGYLKAAKQAQEIGANVFQYFSRNPQGYGARAVDQNDIRRTKNFLRQNDIQTVIHGPYTLNLCAQDARVRATGVGMLQEDLDTAELFGGSQYVFHPGAHTILAREVGIEFIYDNLKKVLNNEDYSSTVLLETMSGRGSEVGCEFQELKTIIDGVERHEQICVCLDTCHVFAAGYDIVNQLDTVLEQFDNIIGLNRLKVVHLNDSANPMGSKKDRHARIGEGKIGAEALLRFINHPKLKHLPFILETPNKTVDGYAEEIKFLKENYND